MRKSLASLILAFSSWLFICPAQAQNITGSTTVDVTGGVVTATCETDLDLDAQAYYEAIVGCSVTDGYGNLVASAHYIDQNGIQGYAQAIVTFVGVPGTAYIATGAHEAETTIRDYALPPPPAPPSYSYLDYYNYGYYQESPYQVYPSLFNFYGPGPEMQRRSSNIGIGGTTGTAVYPVDTAALINKAQSAFSSACNTAFTNVIGPTYTKAQFFQSLLTTTFHQYPAGTPNIPPGHLGVDAFTDPNPRETLHYCRIFMAPRVN